MYAQTVHIYRHTQGEYMSTNGYSIRLDLLKMAKEMLEQDWHAQRDAALTDYQTRVGFAHAKVESEGVDKTTVPVMPTFNPFPSEEQIITKAKVLNEFINQKA